MLENLAINAQRELKKKSGFSSFMNNLVGTPRKPTISAPENPVHVTHVGYDQETGEFTVGDVLFVMTRRVMDVAFGGIYADMGICRVCRKNGSAH